MRTGRPIDAVTTETEKPANKAIASKSPLDVMLENMLFWHQRGDALTLELETVLLGKDDRTYQKHLAEKIFDALVEARENSQRCAVAAAPYVHAKLKPVQPRGEPTNVKITTELPPLRKGEDRSYREGYDGEGLAHLGRKLN